MTLGNLLLQPEMHFILFGGKGGVGKTSTAAAAAIWAADHGRRVLIISTDPAHSLADSLGQKLKAGEITKVEEIENLWGLEIQSKMNKTEINTLMENTDSEMAPLIGTLGDLNPPGIDEAMAFGKILEYLQNSDYDLIIFDTAPTGHTLRLLSIPDMLSGWMGKILSLRLKLGKFFTGFKTLFSKKPNEAAQSLDAFKKLKESMELAKVELSDPNKTSFVVVMISELMAIYETERLLSALLASEMSVKHFIINQLISDQPNCEFCKNRHQMQQKHLREIRSLYADEFNLIEVELFPEEIRKPVQLRKLASIICGPDKNL